MSAANSLLAGAPVAAAIFRRLVGSGPGGPGVRVVEHRAAVAQAPVLGGAFTFLSDFPCGGSLAGPLQVLQAGFALDLAERNTEARWISRARAYIDERTAVVDRYVESIRADLNQRPGAGVPDPRGSRHGSDLGIPADPDIPGGPGGLVPPDGPGEGPPRLPPPDGGELQDPCASVMDLCLGLYQEMAAEALNDHLIDLIQTVRPNCLCHDFNPAQVFTAEPGPGTQFPDPLPPEVMLIYRGADITSSIVHADAARIEFTLPPNPHTGFLYLRSLTQGSRQRRQDLARLCGDLFPPIPDHELIQRSPAALITIAYPPIIDSVRVSGISARDEGREKGVHTVEAEACRPIEICWRARLSDRPASLPLPPCASIVVAVQDETGAKVTTGGPSGCFFDQGSDDREFHFQTTSRAGEATCGRSDLIRLRVRRVARLRLRLDPVGTTQLVEHEQGRLVVSCSCPAPAGGCRVQLAVSRASVLDFPQAVIIREGETEAPVGPAE